MAKKEQEEEERKAREEEEALRFFDPSMGKTKAEKNLARPRRDFKFVRKGRFERQAENMRIRAQFGDEALA